VVTPGALAARNLSLRPLSRRTRSAETTQRHQCDAVGALLPRIPASLTGAAARNSPFFWHASNPPLNGRPGARAREPDGIGLRSSVLTCRAGTLVCWLPTLPVAVGRSCADARLLEQARNRSRGRGGGAVSCTVGAGRSSSASASELPVRMIASMKQRRPIFGGCILVTVQALR